MTDRADTRRRLVDMRERLLDDLDHQIDGGVLALLTGVNSALAAIDAGAPVDGEPAERAIVADDGKSIRLTLYTAEGPAATAEVPPIRALTIATELVAAAIARLR